MKPIGGRSYISPEQFTNRVFGPLQPSEVDAIKQAYFRLGLWIGFFVGVVISCLAIVLGAQAMKDATAEADPDILDCITEASCPWPSEDTRNSTSKRIQV